MPYKIIDNLLDSRYNFMFFSDGTIWPLPKPGFYDVDPIREKKVYFLRTTPKVVIRAISHVYRYNGHALITVAQHSINVAHMVFQERPALAFAALLHDWHEVLTGYGDIFGPFKKYNPDQIKAENFTDTIICEAMRIETGDIWSETIKKKDSEALTRELLSFYSEESVLKILDAAKIQTPGLESEYPKMERKIISMPTDIAFKTYTNVFNALNPVYGHPFDYKNEALKKAVANWGV